ERAQVILPVRSTRPDVPAVLVDRPRPAVAERIPPAVVAGLVEAERLLARPVVAAPVRERRAEALREARELGEGAVRPRAARLLDLAPAVDEHAREDEHRDERDQPPDEERALRTQLRRVFVARHHAHA